MTADIYVIAFPEGLSCPKKSSSSAAAPPRGRPPSTRPEPLCNRLCSKGAISEENRLAGTLPLGQLALTTEVENYPGFPCGDLTEYLASSLAEEKRQFMAPHNKEGVSGPELMELMRQQAVNFGTRIITEDVIDVDFSAQPFKLTATDGNTYESHAVIVATGARANYLGLPSEEKYQEPRRQCVCRVRRGAAAIPQQAAGGDRRRRFGRRRGRLLDQVRQRCLSGPSSP